MASETPPFWWMQPDWRAAALAPLAALYGSIAARRLRNAPRRRVDLPVLCIGNFTVGGSGKTPVAIAFARAAKAMNLSPGILSRGHGGSFSAPHIVDAHHDSARHVGDEPLLLAGAAPVAVTADRAAGAKLLTELGCDFLIMDDGFQSARIHIDYALMVVDARYGLGNGRVVPAGPLRAALVDQLPFVGALLVMGDGSAADDVVRAASRAGRAVYHAGVVARQSLHGRRFLAFAGIGHPQKFFATAAAAGGALEATRIFADHHAYSELDLRDLADTAARTGLELLTTAKDAVRIGRERLQAMAPGGVSVLEIDAVFDSDGTPRRIIEATMGAARERRFSGVSARP